MYSLSVCAQAVWGGMAPSCMSSEEACTEHVEEEVHRDLEGPSTNVSLKQNSSGVGTDVEGKQAVVKEMAWTLKPDVWRTRC